MDPTDSQLLDALGLNSTDIGSGGVSDPGSNVNPSTGIGVTDLLSQLIGTAGQSYVAAAQASQPAVYTTAPQGTLTIGGTPIATSTLFFIGAGVLLFALVLRR